MAQAVHELRVFLASPGDVEAERAAVRDVANRINARFEDLGVRVQIVGWEQIQAEFGRPQGLINPQVHKCDVFIGLLNRRWGSDTGLYSSGFEEEFEEVMRRRQETGHPAIGMFFAELSQDQLDDPGDQLKAVLAFQERIRNERIALYKQYSSRDHLATEVLDLLTGHALELAGRVDGDRGDDAGRTPAGNTDVDDQDRERAESGRLQDRVADDSAAAEDVVTVAKPTVANDAAQQIAEALRGFAAVFDAPDAGLSAGDRDRVTLVGTAFAVDERLLGTHHVNRLFRRRDELKLTNGEVWAWLRTYFADRDDDRANRTVPVWGLFQPQTENGKDFGDDLAMMAANDDIRVSRGAIAFLTDHRLRPPNLWPAAHQTDACNGPADPSEDEGKEVDHDGPAPAKAAIEAAVSRWEHMYRQQPGAGLAANYMIAVGTKQDLHMLDLLAVDDELGESSKAVVEAIAASLRGDPKLLATLAPSEYVNGADELVDRILASIGELGEPEWRSLLTSRNSKLAVPAAVELIGLGRLNKDDLVAYLKLNNAQVDAALAEKAATDTDVCTEVVRLLREDKGLADDDRRLARIMAVVVPRDGLEQLHASDPYRQTMWEAQTIQNPAGMLEQAREVLDDRAEFLQQKVAPLLVEYETLASHIIAECKRSACALLTNVACQETAADRAADLDRAVAELARENYRTRDAALSAVVALVDEATADRVPVALIDGYWVTGRADQLLASPLGPHLVERWGSSSISGLQRAAASWFIRQPGRTDAELEEATYDEDTHVRMAAIDVILSRWTREQVIELLGRYDQQQRPYWYNVIAAMDEYLYGYSAMNPKVSDGGA